MKFPANLGIVFTLKCRQASQLLSHAQDAELASSERVALRLHLLICGSCRKFNRQLLLLRQVIQLLVGRSRAGQTTGARLTEDRRRHLLQRIALAFRKRQ